MTTALSLLAAGFWLLASYTIVLAQPSSIYGRDTAQVYVRDSAVAIEKFALAERMERLREWSKAADVYQEVLASYSDRVVPSKVDADNRIVQYTSVVPAVQERLSKWPAEGLAAYRARYDAEAQALLDSARAGDVAPLHKTFATYFITAAGKSAGVRLIDAYLEAGEFPAAAWTASRLLAWYPDLGPDRPRILYRAALAYHLAGDDELARANLGDLKSTASDALGKVRGEDVRLVDSLEDQLRAPRPTRSAASGDSWPMIFGSPDRALLSPSVGQIGTKVHTIDLVKFESAMPGAQQPAVGNRNEVDRRSGLMTGVYPVVDRGELFFQDNARVYAINLESGMPPPGWVASYDGDRSSGRYVAANAWPTPRNWHYAVSVTEDSVLAIMGQPDAMLSAMTGLIPTRDTRLVCLDRATGRERWVVRPKQLPAELAGNARDLDLSGSPLVVNDDVYVIGRGGKGLQFEDCYVMCFDLGSGAFKWASYIASANVGGQFFDIDLSGSSGQSLSHLAYSGGRLFVCTNLGATAALSAYDGTIAWLNIYPREQVDVHMRFRARIQQSQQSDKPWTFNPVIVTEGRVFALPSDGRFIHVYDAGTGTEVRRIDLRELVVRSSGPGGGAGVQPASIEPPRAMLAVMGDRMLLQSPDRVFCLNWQAYDAKKPLRENVFWYTIPFQRGAGRGGPSGASGGSAGPGDSINGRAFVSRDAVFVPLNWQLARISLENGAVTWSYPAAGTWGEGEGPGNVLATAEHLIVAGPTRVNVYTDLSLATAKLDAAIAASPGDPEPRLRYAEILFLAGGRLDAAIERLDEAAARMGGRQSLAPGPNRDRLFTDALSFAQKLSREARGATTEQIDGLFDRAAEAADSPPQRVGVRLSRAEHARSTNNPATEMRLLQEILSDAQLREVPVARGPGVGARQAGTVAAAGIGELLKRADGRQLYEPYEAQAAQKLDALRAGSNPAALIELAQVYPNADSARQALQLAADQFEAASDPRQALQALRQLYFRHGTSGSDGPAVVAERLRIIESLARNYLTMPNRLEVSAARLAQAAKLNPKATLTRPMRLPDGQLVARDTTFSDALELVRRLQSKAMVQQLPDLLLPRSALARDRVALDRSPEALAPIAEQVERICEPSAPEHARPDRLVTFSAVLGLSVYSAPAVASAARTREQAGAEPVKPMFSAVAGLRDRDTGDGIANLGGDDLRAPRGIAWTGGNLLVWSGSRLAMLEGDSGQAVWQLSTAALPAVEMITTSGPELSFSTDAADDGRANAGAAGGVADNAVIDNAGAMIVVNGQIVQGQDLVIRGGAARLRIRDARMMARANLRVAGLAGNRNVALAGAAGAGRDDEIGAAAGATGEEIISVHPLSDRVIVATSGGRIASIDPTDGQLQWQSRPARGAPARLVVNDDFVVVQFSAPGDVADAGGANAAEAGTGNMLLALDAFSGQAVYRRTFARSATTGLPLPLNIGLAGDGTLVWVLPDRIVGKDLFEPADTLRFGGTGGRGNENELTFAVCRRPDQLLIADGRIMALSENGVAVRVLSLETGRTLRNEADGAEMRLATGLRVSMNGPVLDAPVGLRNVGPMLYVVGPQSLWAYNLDVPGESWYLYRDFLLANGSGFNLTREQAAAWGPMTIRDVQIARDHLIATVQPSIKRPVAAGAAAMGNAAAALIAAASEPPPDAVARVLFLNRAEVPGRKPRESGYVDAVENLANFGPITAVHLSAEGLFCLTADGKLRFLRPPSGSK